MQTIDVREEDLRQLQKVLNWVKDNPGCHPENIRKELLKLHTVFVMDLRYQ